MVSSDQVCPLPVLHCTGVQGSLFSASLRTERVVAEYRGHHGRAAAPARNPGLLKIFSSAGDCGLRVWAEDVTQVRNTASWLYCRVRCRGPS